MKATLREMKEKSKTESKYIQTIYPTKDSYLEYIKDSKHSRKKKAQTIPLENGKTREGADE